MITVFLLADDVVAGARLRIALARESGVLLLGESESVMRALERVPELSPAVILVDLRSPGSDPIGAVRLLRSVCPDGAIVVLDSYLDAEMRSRARAAGATALISRLRSVDSILAEIKRATFHAA